MFTQIGLQVEVVRKQSTFSDRFQGIKVRHSHQRDFQ